ncbi:Alpha-mannosidase I MNS5 [Camellia lanceoleosa]|uniref:Alpha-mannosidase I MNS5 n=1 Tax=Camellia lanceoleosa TaxID=1840588 RepID=A0ACC0GP30_9ERIC|nr:Alpha-mannosidase I MNS5 [Camellia lanceoleosa]
MTYAFLHDELKPLAKTFTDSLVELGNLKCNIRVLGGLVSAHILATDSTNRLVQRNYKNQLLILAEDLRRRFLPAFDTPTGLPYAWINLKDWGFFMPYLIGSISLVVLAVGSISPGRAQLRADREFRDPCSKDGKGTMVPGIKTGRRKRATSGNVLSTSEACAQEIGTPMTFFDETQPLDDTQTVVEETQPGGVGKMRSTRVRGRTLGKGV